MGSAVGFEAENVRVVVPIEGALRGGCGCFFFLTRVMAIAEEKAK